MLSVEGMAQGRTSKWGIANRWSPMSSRSSSANIQPRPSILLNLHARDLADLDLRRAGGPMASSASRIILEVTERASLDQVENPNAAVAALPECGFRIAVDDLGAGYARHHRPPSPDMASHSIVAGHNSSP